MKRNKKGFTLIELIAVLVILAILALIVTPLVLNVIKKARVSADKRSIDAYGKSIELAIATYLLDNGDIPTSIEQLTIEYTGDKVECSQTNINSDASVYLASCRVNGRIVEGYTYGKDNTPTYEAYSVGDEVTYNNVNYYVIKDSDATESTVTLLKAEPLSVAEVNQYGTGHVNRYTISSQGTAYNNNNGYGGMAYYSSSTCGYINNDRLETGCINDYAQSEIKYAIDAWKTVQASAAIEARLITVDDFENLGYEWKQSCGTCSDMAWVKTDAVPEWMYNSNYDYWSMSQVEDSVSAVWFVLHDGRISYGTVFVGCDSVVRPVIVLSKSEL